MSTLLGDHLPQSLQSRLSADRAFDEADRAIVICSVDDRDFPHPAMLSSLELIATDATAIRLAVYGASTTARNLRANGRLTIVLADERGVFYVKGDASLIKDAMNAAPELAVFSLRVDAVLHDDPANHENARVVSGIRVERGTVNVERGRLILSELIPNP